MSFLRNIISTLCACSYFGSRLCTKVFWHRVAECVSLLPQRHHRSCLHSAVQHIQSLSQLIFVTNLSQATDFCVHNPAHTPVYKCVRVFVLLAIRAHSADGLCFAVCKCDLAWLSTCMGHVFAVSLFSVCFLLHHLACACNQKSDSVARGT